MGLAVLGQPSYFLPFLANPQHIRHMRGDLPLPGDGILKLMLVNVRVILVAFAYLLAQIRR